MASFMARHRGSDGNYADLECGHVELERYLVLISIDTAPAAAPTVDAKIGRERSSDSKAVGGTQPQSTMSANRT